MYKKCTMFMKNTRHQNIYFQNENVCNVLQKCTMCIEKIIENKIRNLRKTEEKTKKLNKKW